MSLAFPPSISRHLDVAGMSERPPSTTIRTQPEQGPAIVRNRRSANVRPVVGSLTLTREELAVFDEFFVTTTGGGALQWDWTHPRTNADVVFRFIGEPEYIPMSSRNEGEDDADMWQVRVNLEILPSTAGGGTAPPVVPPADGFLLPIIGITSIGEDDADLIVSNVIVFEGVEEQTGTGEPWEYDVQSIVSITPDENDFSGFMVFGGDDSKPGDFNVSSATPSNPVGSVDQ